VTANLCRLAQASSQTLYFEFYLLFVVVFPREVIVPDVLEECILSATVKHLSLTETLQSLSMPEQFESPDYCLLHEVMRETYRRLNAMLRQLQVRNYVCEYSCNLCDVMFK
jgi:hypothetical protein